MKSFLKDFDKRYESIFDNSPHGLAIVSIKGDWLEVNHKICSITGYPKEELLETNFQSITHPEDLGKDLNKVKQLLDRKIDSYTMEKRYIRKDGSMVWVLLSASAVFDENNQVKYFVAQVQDITREKILRYREKIIFDDGDIGLAICDKNGKWLEANKKFATILEYSVDELLTLDFQTITHPDDLKQDLKFLQQFLELSLTVHSWKKRYITKFGNPVWCIVSVKKTNDIESNDTIFVCSIQSIDELVKMESDLTVTNNKLLKTVEELMHFNYFASHDLKESVRTIHNYCEIVAQDPEKNKKYLTRIADKSEHLNNLIDDLLLYSKLSATKDRASRFSATQTIQMICEDFRNEILIKNLKINCHFDDDLHLFTHKTTFYHILFNLISNAIKYAHKNIDIYIRLSKFRTLVKIYDDGDGVDLQFHKKIFEPFFRLHDKLNGTGLGLSLCKKMVEKLGGKISIKSQNNSTLFWFYFKN